MLSFILFTLLSLLAGRVIAFNITVGDNNLSASQILAIPDSPVTQACNTSCSDTSSRISACNDDATCLCQSDSVASLLACETCMFHFLIATNEPAPDFRAGSNPVLSAYAAACQSEANISLANTQTALQLPSNWDGPFDSVLPIGAAAVTVAVGAVLGMSGIWILCNMD